MAQRLKNILRFVGLTPNTPTSLPHGLQTSLGLKLRPDLVALAPATGFTVSADDTNVTVTGNGTAVDVYCEAWHTIERAFGDNITTSLVPQPFAIGGDGNNTAYGNLVFRPGGVADGNVYTDWAALVAAAQQIRGYKTIQFDDSIVSPCVIPAGAWNMAECEWTGFLLGASPNTVQISLADGATFINLRKVGGDLTITNNNTLTAPVTIAPAGGGFASIFEFGAGTTGDYPSINNVGAAPFFDCSGLLVGQRFLIRMQGSISGSTPAVELGASPGNVSFALFDSARVHAGMVNGGVPGSSQIGVFLVGSGAQFCRQPTFNGTISYGRPSGGAFDFAQTPWPRMWAFPASVDQAPTAPSAIAFTSATGLGMNACLRLDTGAIAGPALPQPLPIIRAAAPAVGSFAITPGVLDSTGLIVIIKNEAGVNNISVTPDLTTPDTIDGGAGPVVIPPGGSRTFLSDGVSNWSIVGGYL